MKSLFLLLPAAALLASCESTPEAAPPDRFANADIDHDSRLSRPEMSDYVVSSIFASRDANHDGNMTVAEWNPENDAAQRKTFNLRDANRDGSVTLAEACDYGRKAKAHDDVFKSADTNKDGGITREEATAYYASKEGPFR